MKTRCIIIGNFIFIVTLSLQAQSLRESMREDRKRTLMEGIKPPVLIKDPAIKKTNEFISTDDSDLGINRRNEYGINKMQYEKEYIVNPAIKITQEELFRIEPGTPLKTIIIGNNVRNIPKKEYEYRLDEMSQRYKLEGVSASSSVGGLNLSGYKKKKMSEKAKQILKYVFGVEVEE